MQTKILIVEDEFAIREMVRFSLTQNGYAVLEAQSASQALQVIADQRPDLVLLDWMLPGMSGIELAYRLRKEDYTRKLPIIMLTARGEEQHMIQGLEAGADDYVTKPFSPRELTARIKAVLRRAQDEQDQQQLQADGLVLDIPSQRVTTNALPVETGPTEFRLLRFFMSNAERVFSRGQLLDNVWGRNVYVEERTVDVHIRRLRKALSMSGYDRYIQTVRGVGYRFSKKV